MDSELTALEERVQSLIAHACALREVNEALQGELRAAQERNRDLSARVAQAGSRLDALLSRMTVE
jgi:chromosome segregation ATPase